MIHDVLEKVKSKDLDGAIDDLIKIAESTSSPKTQALAFAETYHIEYLKEAPPEVKEQVAQDVATRLQELADTRFGAKGGLAHRASKVDPLTRRQLTKNFALLDSDKKKRVRKGSVTDRHWIPTTFGPSDGTKPASITLEEFK